MRADKAVKQIIARECKELQEVLNKVALEALAQAAVLADKDDNLDDFYQLFFDLLIEFAKVRQAYTIKMIRETKYAKDLIK
jgi:hypothetical protein